MAKRGDKTVYSFVANDEKECLTTLVMCNAAGDLPPPLVVYSYKRIPKVIASTFPKNWAIGRSENGWMTQESFFEYIANPFLNWLKENHIPLPIVLFIDGHKSEHKSHLNMQLSQFCSQNGIILISLYPNSTHILQPLDVAVFHPLKSVWKKITTKWRSEHCAKAISREEFAPLLQDALKEVKSLPLCIANGFKTCGLVPLDPDNIKYEKFFITDAVSQKQSTASLTEVEKKNDFCNILSK